MPPPDIPKQQIVGLFNHSNMITFAASRMGFNVGAAVEYPTSPLRKTTANYARQILHQQEVNLIIDKPFWKQEERQDPVTHWSKQGLHFQDQLIVEDPWIVYSQPFIPARSSNNQDIMHEIKMIFELTLAQSFKPEFFLFITTAYHKEQILEYFQNNDFGYRWTVIKINAPALSVPIRSSYFIIIGSRNGLSPAVAPIHIKEITTVWDVLHDETINELPNSDPLPNQGIQLKMLWDSSSILKPGECLYHKSPRDFPQSLKDYMAKGRTLLKIQYPLRLEKDFVAPTISVTPRMIHPVEPRPLSIREMARLLRIPDNVQFHLQTSSTMRFIGNVIPLPVSEYAFDLILRIKNRQVNESNQPFIHASSQVEEALKNINRWHQSKH